MGQGVLHLGSKVLDRILDLGMSKKQLDRSKIANPPTYQRDLRTAQ
jgi:hypothetical protein